MSQLNFCILKQKDSVTQTQQGLPLMGPALRGAILARSSEKQVKYILRGTTKYKR